MFQTSLQVGEGIIVANAAKAHLPVLPDILGPMQLRRNQAQDRKTWGELDSHLPLEEFFVALRL